ncbi:Uncharacterised protein [Mycobacteroides abscessus subsp. abscessus]|nr:Uncharacterised protein [Mycobacteroides abscessus subsp. abscessus]SHV99751.1 Uncharacterised protein [Mycobacteroides abscessus subsp. abscessus]SIL98613.1 Uncharacterised protein [Mycobacteroides abscessus subsp. abscessus]SKT99426.1 Uncharacterised protein [Mycobacteroides abscessus subsp. abscessus]SKX31703.1 Uncharacterised protein [Mycobacteroides abscessus subsp. abscessus]
MDSSISTFAEGEAESPSPAMRSTSSAVYAMPEPRPPMVNDGRTTTGSPRSATVSRTSSMVKQTRDLADSPPTLATMSLKRCRSSPRWMASKFAPMSSTPYRSSAPFSYSATAVFSAVWPPSVGNRASILLPFSACAAMTFSTNSAVIGST